MTRLLQSKIAQLSALLASEKDRKKMVTQLQKDIDKLIDSQPDLPHKGQLVWTWSGETLTYGHCLMRGQVTAVTWRSAAACFKVGIQLPDKWKPVWRTLDRVWITRKAAENWDLLRQIEAAKNNLEHAQKKLDELNSQLREATGAGI